MNSQPHDAKTYLFDEVDPSMLKAELGYNEIKTIVNKYDSNFSKKKQSSRIVEIIMLSDCTSIHGEECGHRWWPIITLIKPITLVPKATNLRWLPQNKAPPLKMYWSLKVFSFFSYASFRFIRREGEELNYTTMNLSLIPHLFILTSLFTVWYLVGFVKY